MKSIAFSLLPALLALGAATASAQTVTTVLNNGPTGELYDIVILGDGYRSADQAQFNQDVLDTVNYFRTDPSKFPYGEYFDCYNVHSVFRASVETGADDPCATPPVVRNTAYDASYCVGGTARCLYINNTTQAATDAALAPDSDGRVIVIVNSSRYGGCASTYSVSYNGSSMEEVQAHEWGHSFGLLADEYDYGQTGPYTGGEPTRVNCTADPTGAVKWAHWLGFSGQYSTVGAFAGACYYPPTPLPTLYRPESDCEMKNLNRRFCTVCREQLIKRFHQECSMIASPQQSPAGSAAQFSTVTFSFTNRIASRPNTIEWRVDGGSWNVGAASFNWSVGSAAVGPHTIEARLTDTSPEVRNDPASDLVHTHTWNLNVTSGASSSTCVAGETVPAAYDGVSAGSATSYPWGTSSSIRAMYAYDGRNVSTDGPVRFDALLFRPAPGSGTLGAAVYDFALDISTSRNPALSLDTTFDNNHGADRVRAFDGVLNTTGGALGSSPEEWLIRIPLTTPFEWDPRSGPLVLDFRYRSGSGALTNCEGAFNTGEHIGRIVNTSSANATTSSFPSGGTTQNFALTVRLCVEDETVPAAYAGAEANSSSSYPWNRSAGMRVQYVYDGTEFGFDGRYRINRLMWRTDSGNAFGGDTYDIKVTLSTGAAGLSGTLSTTFDSNHGTDRTVVFDGVFTAPATAAGVSPDDWTIELELDRPFDFNPGNGSLVVDMQLRSASGSAGTSFDGAFNTGEAVARISSTTGPNATTGGAAQAFAYALGIGGAPCPTVPEARDLSFGSSSSFPWNSSGGMRVMYSYDPAALAHSGPIFIQHLRWRPNGSATTFGPVNYDVRIDLSTSALASGGAMSATFGNNHGPDQATVFDGVFSVPYTELSGNPEEWPISVQLDTPFYWDPSAGPLVVDLRSRGFAGGGNTTSCDGSISTDPVWRIAHTSDPNAATATFNGGNPQNFGYSISLCGTGCNGQAIVYGSGCAGTNGVPINSTIGLPTLPNPTFGYRVANAVAGNPALLLMDLVPTSIPLDPFGAIGCSLLNPGALFVGALTASATGDASLVTPLPSSPLLNGFTLYTQWFVWDPAANSWGFISSAGLEVKLCY